MFRSAITAQIRAAQPIVRGGPTLHEARFSPSQFVVDATMNEVRCNAVSKSKYWVGGRNEYCGMPYASGNADFDKKQKAPLFKQAVKQVLAEANLGTLSQFLDNASDFDVLKTFTGQPKLSSVAKLTGLVLDHDEKFKKTVIAGAGGKLDFSKYFSGAPREGFPIEEMAKESLWGMDCIGFVGRYLEAAGVIKKYEAHARLSWQYADWFYPITDIEEAEDLCVGIACNGKHVVMIDSIQRSGNTLHALICQSAGGGVQSNQAKFVLGSSNSDDKKDGVDLGVLDFGTYFVDTGKPMEEAWRAAWLVAIAADPGLESNTTLRSKMKLEFEKAFKAAVKLKDSFYNTTRGYRNGLIFMLSGAGTLASGLFYIGKLPGGIRKLY